MPIYFYLLVLVMIPISFVVLLWLHNQNWFLKLTDDSYKLFNKAYESYRNEVKNRKKLYDRYVDDFCIQHASQVPDLLNKHGIVVSSNKKNCIRNRVQKLLETRPDLVQKYFQESTFTFKDYKQMVEEFDATVPIQKTGVDLIESKQNESKDFSFQKESSNKKSVLLEYSFLNKINFDSVQNNEDKLNLIKEIILLCYSQSSKRQFGDRIFGYLIKSQFIPTITTEDQLNEWHKIFGEEMKPSNPTLLSTPGEYSRYHDGLKSKKLYNYLLLIQEIFNKTGLELEAEIVGEDLVKMNPYKK